MSMQCPICFDNFTREGPKCPKLLPCSHTFCADCLQKLGRFIAECPECKQRHTKHADEFPTNTYILQIFDLKTQLRSQSHELIATRIELKQTLQRIENPVICDQHEKLCFKFCIQEECWVPLCSKCPLQEHETHEFVAITKDTKDYLEREKYRNRFYCLF